MVICAEGALWDERGTDCGVTLEDLTEKGQKMISSNGALLCYTYMK